MASKFDQIIESIVNGDEKKARSLFHNFVVNRSRRIYEGLEQADPMGQSEGADDFIDEVEMEQNHGGDDAAGDFGSTEDDEFGGDATDDLVADTGDDFAGAEADVDDFSDDMSADGVENADMEDRVVDLEDELDSLKAEFAKLMGEESESADDTGDDDFADTDDAEDSDDFDSDFGDTDDEDTDDEDTDDDDVSDFDDTDEDDDDEDDDTIREYVEKVAKPVNSENGGTNTKSTVAGKNDMGGSTKNIAKGSSEEKGRTTPSSESFGKENINVPGGKANKMKNAPKPKTGEDSGVNKKSTY